MTSWGTGGPPPADAATMDGFEAAIDALLAATHYSAPHQLPDLVSRHAASFGASDATVHLVDLQQTVLVPFLAGGRSGAAIRIEGTIAGRAFQHLEVLTQAVPDAPDAVRVWLPLLDGSDRLGALALTVSPGPAGTPTDGVLGARLRRFATIVAELVATKTLYGDTIVRLRRRGDMGLAAELQWSLLPPLTFAYDQVSVAGALEPAYQVAGDTLDYAVDAGRLRAAVFDAMGHGLRSSQLAAVAIAAYRNARRADRSLTETVEAVHTGLVESFGGESFATGVLLDLDTDTGRLTWVNAGHPEPLLLREGRLVKTLYCAPTLPLGIQITGTQRATAVVVGQENLQPGDRVLLYTDGVTEARSVDGEFFGEDRLADLLTRNLAARLPTPETMRRVVLSLLEHQAGQLTDDATLLLVEWRPGEVVPTVG